MENPFVQWHESPWYRGEAYKVSENVIPVEHCQPRQNQTETRWNNGRLSDFQNSAGKKHADRATWLQTSALVQEKRKNDSEGNGTASKGTEGEEAAT